jgi:hypothetical protein
MRACAFKRKRILNLWAGPLYWRRFKFWSFVFYRPARRAELGNAACFIDLESVAAHFAV